MERDLGSVAQPEEGLTGILFFSSLIGKPYQNVFLIILLPKITQNEGTAAE